MVRESMVASLLSPERYSFMLRIWCAGVVINVRMKLNLGQKKNVCVSNRPTDPNIFYAKKNNRSAKSGNSSLFPCLFLTSTIDSVSCFNLLHFLVHCSPGFYGTTVVNV